jgi:hypothetical protein
VLLDSQRKLRAMKKNPAAVAVLQEKYDRLRQSLAQTGPISEGSVLQRSPATSGRSGYQWTRKVAGKTVAVALSQPQFAALKKAVTNPARLSSAPPQTPTGANPCPRKF